MSTIELYTESASVYDEFELKGEVTTRSTNALLLKRLKEHKARKVHDMSCGTGAQAIGLAKAGFQTTASDINTEMLEIAESKASASGLKIQFRQANMISVSPGPVDAIISMYNSIGHLTKDELLQTLANAKRNLNPGGTVIFDIFNRAIMPLLPRYEFIDRAIEKKNQYYVRFTKFDFDKDSGYLNVKQTALFQQGVNEIKRTNRSYSLMTYKKNELVGLIQDAGLEVEEISEHGLSDFYESEHPLVGCLMHLAVARSPAKIASDVV